MKNSDYQSISENRGIKPSASLTQQSLSLSSSSACPSLRPPALLSSLFWSTEVTSARSLEGVASLLPRQLPPPPLLQASGLSRSQQILLLQRLLRVPFLPSFAVDEDGGGGWVADRVLAAAGGRNWWSTLTGRLRMQRMWTHSSSNPQSAASPVAASGPRSLLPSRLDPSVAALSFRSRVVLRKDHRQGPPGSPRSSSLRGAGSARQTALLAGAELDSLALPLAVVRGLVGRLRRGAGGAEEKGEDGIDSQQRTNALSRPSSPSDWHVWAALHHRMERHQLSLKAAANERCIDRSGRYSSLPASLSLDLCSLPAAASAASAPASGLRYRVGLLHAAGGGTWRAAGGEGNSGVEGTVGNGGESAALGTRTAGPVAANGTSHELSNGSSTISKGGAQWGSALTVAQAAVQVSGQRTVLLGRDRCERRARGAGPPAGEAAGGAGGEEGRQRQGGGRRERGASWWTNMVPRLTLAASAGALLSARLHHRGFLHGSPSLPSPPSPAHLPLPFHAEAFGSLSATLQAGLAERLFLDHSLLSAAVAAVGAPAAAGRGARGAWGPPGGVGGGALLGGTEGGGGSGGLAEWQELPQEASVSVCVQQQLVGPLRLRCDLQAPLLAGRQDSPPSRSLLSPPTATVSLECVVRQLGGSRVVAWFNPRRREGAVELRLLHR